MKPILLDVMVGDHYECQLRYTKHGYPELINGEIIEVYKEEDLKSFVEECRPSLKGRNYKIFLTDNRICRS